MAASVSIVAPFLLLPPLYDDILSYIPFFVVSIPDEGMYWYHPRRLDVPLPHQRAPHKRHDGDDEGEMMYPVNRAFIR